jgi:uncharacterized membrane protein YhhN
MTTVAWAFAAATAVFAVVDWWAAASDRQRVRHVSKPATLVALIGVAVTLDPTVSPGIRTAMVIGLVFSLGGDVFLLLPEKWFVAGLGSFLVGHIAYVVAMQAAPTSVAGTLVGLAVVGIGIALVGQRVVRGVAAGEHRQLVGPVIAYLAVISAMVVSAFGTEAAWAVVGASLFYASDATLAWNRFLTPLRWGPLAVIVTYHLGQMGLVAWLVTG